MTYPISDVTRRVVYSGSAGTGPYTFTFEVLTQGDIGVYKNSTLLTLTTDYTVTINVDGTGYITLVSAATAADTIAIFGNKGIQRSTDFVTGGDLFANSLNDELDAQTIFAQQNAEAIVRSIRAPQFDPTGLDMTLPEESTRAGKVLGFDGAGQPTVTSSTVAQVDGIVNTVNALAAATPGSSAAVSHIADGVGAVATTVQAKLRETVSVKDFGAIGDGVTDDDAAIQAAIAYAVANVRAVYFPAGTYKYSTTISLAKNGIRIYGDAGGRVSKLWYTGTTAAIKIPSGSRNVEIDHLLITSLDPTTANFLVGNNAGTGSAAVGILVEFVDNKIHNNTICYFNDPALYAAAIKTNGNNCFSNLIEHNYIRYNWNGISLEDVITDTSVIDNTILDTEKCAISVGYDWNTGSQTSFTGDNFRIENNLINNVCCNFNPGGGVGDGYGIRLSRCATTLLSGNYIEDVRAETGFTSYGIYVDGMIDGSYALNTNIINNNAVTDFSGTKYSLYITKAWYGNIIGNHFDDNNGSATLDTDARWFVAQSNYFTGAPSTPYDLTSSTQSYAFNGPAGEFISSGTALIKYRSRHFDDVEFSPDNSVNIGQVSSFRPANVYAGTLVSAPTVTASSTLNVGASKRKFYDGGEIADTTNKTLTISNLSSGGAEVHVGFYGNGGYCNVVIMLGGSMASSFYDDHVVRNFATGGVTITLTKNASNYTINVANATGLGPIYGGALIDSFKGGGGVDATTAAWA